MIILAPVFNEVDHSYRDHAGIPYPSVTQLLHRSGLIKTRFYNQTGEMRGTRVHERERDPCNGDKSDSREHAFGRTPPLRS